MAVSRLLNLGCGQRFHPAWTNLDLHPAHPSVRHWDVTQPLPLANGTFDVVYHSHLLEHLPRQRTLPFLRECHRVLCPGGILRLAVPDLEGIARLYLAALDEAWQGDSDARQQHEWLMMELYDQTTREQPGGEMISYLCAAAACGVADTSLAWYRLGVDGAVIRQHRHQVTAPATWRDRLRGWLFGSWRERLIRWLLGKEYPLLQLGRFRRSGELHQWMYDRVALRDLLTQAGFVDFRCVGPTESAIANWIDYHLDTTPDGAVSKPDSLYVEAERGNECPNPVGP